MSIAYWNFIASTPRTRTIETSMGKITLHWHPKDTTIIGDKEANPVAHWSCTILSDGRLYSGSGDSELEAFKQAKADYRRYS